MIEDIDSSIVDEHSLNSHIFYSQCSNYDIEKSMISFTIDDILFSV